MGFLFLDWFQHRNQWENFKDMPKFSCLLSVGKIGSEKVLLVKPMTFMNLSGKSISAIVRFYGIDVSKDLLVISDDIDLPFGKVRFRASGSHGGQKGLESTIQEL